MAANSQNHREKGLYAFGIFLVRITLLYVAFLLIDPFFEVSNLLATFIHEGAHALAAFSTGAHFVEITINPDSSGTTQIDGGELFIVMPIGYLSVPIISALMFLINNRTRWGEVIPFLMGVTMICLTVKFGIAFYKSLTTQLVGYGFGFFLIYIGYHPKIKLGRIVTIDPPEMIWKQIINGLALYYGFIGVVSIIAVSTFATHGESDDISRFTDMYFPYVHPATMAWIFVIISLLIWLAVFYLCAKGWWQYLRSKLS
jgi:hypothetical protein